MFNSYDLVIISFTLIIFISFLWLLFWNNNKYLEKIIWGLSILVFALVIKDNILTYIAIFIWWLLIATETFLLYIASIFKSWESNIPKIIDSYNDTIKISKTTQSEKEVKLQNEFNEILLLEEQDINSNDKIDKKELLLNMKEIEQNLDNKIKEITKEYSYLKFEKDKKITSNKWNTIYLDWILKDSDSNFVAGIEYKYIPNWKLLDEFLFKNIERIISYDINIPIILIMVSDNFDGDSVYIANSFSIENNLILLLANYKNNKINFISNDYKWKIIDTYFNVWNYDLEKYDY